MSRTLKIFALGLTGLAAAGCTSPPLNNDARQYTSAEQQFPITVEPQVATLAIQVDGDLRALARGEDARIAMFAERWKTRGQGLLNVATPGGRPADAGAMTQLKKVLAANGVERSAVKFSTYNPASGDTQAPITLSFVAFAATATECSHEWPENLAFNPRNVPRAEFGCTTQHNFAAVIADPHDLIEPRTSEPAEATRRTVVMEKYQQGIKTQTEHDAKDSGQSSTVNTSN